MVLHFPNKLTEEEEALQSKYAKLRRKKKQLQDVNKPKQEPEQNKLKRPSEAKDAKEVAKKLLKTGAMKAIKNSLQKEKNKDEKTIGGFKRSKGFERKLNGMDRAMSSYQPFSATHGPGGGVDTGGGDFEPEIPEALQKTKQKNLYENFVKERDREERGLKEDTQNKPRVGHTVYVYGYGITEDMLRSTFTQFGQIVNISMEVEKNCGFITYEKVESTERSIAEVNGTMVGGVQLKVSLARRQPVIDPINDASSSSTWSTIAASHSQKGSHRDKREMVTYDEDLF